MKLIITEKPSVAQGIAKVLNITKRENGYMSGNNYIITWCVGHLIQLAMPEEYDTKLKEWNIDTLPIFPQKFKLVVNNSTKDQYEIVKRLLNSDNVDEVICATDAGREGQLIFSYVYINAGCKKPVKRLWISSMTDAAIKEGFNNLKDNREYYLLYLSAKSRSEADWLVGINATRLFSIKYNQKLTIGRVQTPTLAMIVQRQNEIDNFVPEPFYEIACDCGRFTATWFDEDGTRIKSKEKAEKIVKRCENKEGIVTNVTKKKASTERPLLYDLTELQRDGNRKYGYTADQTLEAAQNLYEKYKITTYPRTDSRYLSTDMKPKLERLLHSIKQGYGVASKVIDKILVQKINADKRVIDDTKITDHHAIIVNENIKNLPSINLPDREKNILKLIITRFIVALDKKQEYEQTDIELMIGEDKFKARGKKITFAGWKETEDILLGKDTTNDNDTDGDNENEIKANVKKDDKVIPKELVLLSKITTPPKQYNEATLLTAMETAGRHIEDEEFKESMKSIGLGTPATRAGIIEKLVSVGYIKRNKKNLLPTENGIKLIQLVPEKLKKPDLTGEWEKYLDEITKGKEKSSNFIENIKKYVSEIINDAKNKNENIEFKKNEKDVIGICPRCKGKIYEGEKNYYCEGYNNNPKCTFTLWKVDKNVGKVSKTQAKKLIKGERVLFKNLTSKAGKKYNAYLKLDDTGTYVNIRFDSYENKTK